MAGDKASSTVNGTNVEKKEPVEAVDTAENGAEDKQEDDEEEDIDRFPPEQEAVCSVQLSYVDSLIGHWL